MQDVEELEGRRRRHESRDHHEHDAEGGHECEHRAWFPLDGDGTRWFTDVDLAAAEAAVAVGASSRGIQRSTGFLATGC